MSYQRNDGTAKEPEWTDMREVAPHQAVNAHFLDYYGVEATERRALAERREIAAQPIVKASVEVEHAVPRKRIVQKAPPGEQRVIHRRRTRAQMAEARAAGTEPAVRERPPVTRKPQPIRLARP